MLSEDGTERRRRFIEGRKRPIVCDTPEEVEALLDLTDWLEGRGLSLEEWQRRT